MRRSSTRIDNSRLFDLVAAVVIIATLYFARVVFIPLALALLFSLVLTPPVVFLERIRFPRLLAIVLVVLTLVGLLSLIGWKSSEQFVDLMNELPAYKDTVQRKIQDLKGDTGRSFNKASDTVKELGKAIVTTSPGSAPTSELETTSQQPGSSPARPLAVEVVPAANPIESLQNLLGPLGTAGMVTVFTIFILIGRENLRNRFIRLAGGGGQLNVMTQAIDEATRKINRYLFMQLLVNSGYGVVIGVALHFIGIPHASLWGACAGLLRFLPYIGAPLAALMPLLLSLAVLPGWHNTALTAGVFVSLELAVANAVEPFLYGAHIGLSPLAILVAAIFWTLIWGFPGLVLSTPLTVCLVVLGRYVPDLSFLTVMFGDEPVLPAHAKYYQRLLAADQSEARQILENYLRDKSVDELYGSVIIPALSLVEQDRHRNALDEATQAFIFQSTRELVEELSERPDQEPEKQTEAGDGKTVNPGQQPDKLEVLCIPARDEADEIIAMLAARALERQGYSAQSVPLSTTEDMLSQVAQLSPGIVCISALPPFAVDPTRVLYLKLKAQFPRLDIVVCFWQFDGDIQKIAARVKLAAGHALFTTLPQVLQRAAASRTAPETAASSPLP